MKKFVALSMISLTPLLHAAEDDWSLNNSFAVWGEYIHFRRALGNKQNFMVDTLNGTLDTCSVCHPTDPCKAKDVIKKFKFEPGFRVGAAYMSRHTTVEATYMLIREWEGHCAHSSPGGMFFSEHNPLVLNDYASADHASVGYTSHFENAEANYFRHVSPRRENYVSCSWLLGLRYVHLWEGLDIAFTTYATDTDPQSTSHYEVHANNYFAAAQIGGALQWIPWKHLIWDVIMKVGMGYDWAKQRTFVRDFNDTVVVHNFEVSSGRFPPFIADGIITLGYQLFKGMNAHVGYQLIYLNGLATAPDQVQKKEDYRHRIKVDGEIMIYGFFAGLTLSF
jgi:hypothetical protein